MAGHRKRAGRPTRAAARIIMMQRRLDEAATVDEQLNAAFDWYRSAVKHAPDSELLMRRMTHELANSAYELDRRPKAS